MTEVDRRGASSRQQPMVTADKISKTKKDKEMNINSIIESMDIKELEECIIIQALMMQVSSRIKTMQEKIDDLQAQLAEANDLLHNPEMK